MKAKLLLIAIFSFAIALPNFSQYKITNYTDMNQINNLLEDGDYIWVCTSGGAFKRKKSDGSVATMFNTANSGLARDRVEAMYIDFEGNYWFGTWWGGISRYDGKNWTTINQINGTYISICRSITEDINGNIWFGAEFGKVIKYDGANWELFTLPSTWYVESILSDDLGNMWFGSGSAGGGLWKMDPEGKITKIEDYFGNIAIGGVYDLTKDLYGNIWVAYFGGAMKYNPYSKSWTDYGYALPSNTYSIAQDGDGNLWFGTYFGAYKFNGTTWTTYISGESGDRIDLILDLIADANGNIWLGSYNGLAKVDKVNVGWTPRIEMNAIQSNYIETMAFLSDGSARIMGQNNYVIGYKDNFFREFTANGGCGYGWIKHMVVDQYDNTWIAFLGYSDHILKVIKIDKNDNAICYPISSYIDVTWTDSYIQDVTFDEVANIFWIATPDGIFLLNANNNFFNQATTKNSTLPENNITGVTTLGDNRIWYSTATGGMGYLSYSNFQGVNYSSNDGLPANTCSGITHDKDENIWVTATNNVTKFNGTIFNNFIAPSYYNRIEADNKGNIWLGSSSGGAKFNGTNFRTFSVDDGLNENIVNNITIDNDDNVWFSSGYFGISKISAVHPKPDFDTQITCLPEVTYLTNLSTSVDNLTRYEWDINNDGSIEYTTVNLTHSFDQQGDYVVKLTAYNDDLSSEVVKTITVLESPELSINPTGTNYICRGKFQQITAELLNYDPNLNYSFEWNNGIYGNTIYSDTSGIFYINVSNGQCSSQSDEVKIIASEPFQNAEICLVTVDPEEQKNMIIWERSPNAGIQSYNIYKLYGNNYVPIGNVPYDAEYSYFIDYQSTPEALAARYSITVIDTCGNESDFSPYHQTIQLGSSLGVEPGTYILDWTPYLNESRTWEPDFYYCWSGSSPESMEVIYDISSSFTEWNDTDPGDRKYYQIEVRKANACFVDLPGDKKAGSGPFIHSLSNLEDNRIKTGTIDAKSFEINIYPNPMENWSTLDVAGNQSFPLLLKIMDSKGRILRETEYYDNHIVIERENLTSGFYFIEIQSDRKYIGKMMVK
ncbi:MAG: T9SS type A sorting domain-containing protein [Bacteroidales bacterium]|nr:T9SS type A sorting domain-containing protein [Bacteroidales bacterium]MCF8391586.1 T9SS type A sorting domain-containing protein [Bacteroidales bacterium]